ncbi:MAG: hypothetical protein EU539_08835 [Promethearchaeota archaeon]|nr:MAG: hypothetical protein EU539_08835 [Candidatus Lokiarchaeota archaeon]
MKAENKTFPVYIYEKVLNQIISLCKNSENEIMGELIGNVFKHDFQKYIIIKDLLYIEGAIHSHKFSTSIIEGTLGQYDMKFNEIRDKKGDKNLLRVGWWHSHPNFGCFLSSVDIITQKEIFPASHEVALVIDPINDDLKFFTLDDKLTKGYRAVDYAVITSLESNP